MISEAKNITSFSMRESIRMLFGNARLMGAGAMLIFLSACGGSGGGGGGSNAGQPLERGAQKPSDRTKRDCVGGESGPGVINGSKLANSSTLAKHTVQVYIVRTINPDGNTTGMSCTGSLIAQDVVLLAAHCFDKKSASDPSIKKVEVYHGTDKQCEQAQGLPMAISEINAAPRIHPGWTAGENKNNAYDLALVSIYPPAPSNKVPVKMLSTPPQLTSDMTIYFAGFGKDTPGVEEPPLDDSMLRLVGLNPMGSEQFPNSPTSDLFIFNNSKKGICFGDSGGPSFLATQNGIFQLGVNSAVSSRDSNPSTACTAQAMVVNVSANKQFILDNYLQLTRVPAREVFY